MVLVFMLPACAIIEVPVNNSENQVAGMTQSEANDQPLRIYRILQSRRALLDTLPVGAIVPVFSAEVVRLPENWKYANGDTINDERSPLNGMNLPNLNTDLFLMGSAQNNGLFGGSNHLTPDGQHSHAVNTQSNRTETANSTDHDHTGTTGTVNSNGQNYRVEGTSDTQVRLPSMDHTHENVSDGSHNHRVEHSHSTTSSAAMNHNHGGDNRPRWAGVLYIIKIW